jgi:hypothetical protein
MEEARQVLDRLDRIARLDRDQAPAQVLLDEVRSLLAEAEAWVRAEARDDERAGAAVRAVADSLERRATAVSGAERSLVA